MSVELALGTPLADALNLAIQSKIEELGWAGGGAEGAAMSEYFVLMLANGKTANDISAEIAGDLLGLGSEDQTAPAFAQWLFEQVAALNSQYAPAAAPESNGQSAGDLSQDDMMDGGFDANMDSMADSPSELNAPTGPKAMRAGNPRGGREKRLVGHINRALDRTHDSVLHRVRGQSGIARGPPTGPRMGVGRQPRPTIRTASVAAGIANMGPMPVGPPMGMNGMNNMNGMAGMNGGFMSPDIMAMMEQQSRMLHQMQQQLLMQQQSGMGNTNGHGHGHGQGNGRSLFERTSRGNNFRGRGGHHQHNGHAQQQQQPYPQQQQQPPPQPPAEDAQAEGAQQGEDVDMGQVKEPLSAEETLCKFNLRCSNKDCKFAHQSPAAPPGITIDVKDVCTFGAACKNRKCVGRHPSPATKVAHQSEMDCKFFPNCTNPHCTFRHPTASTPLCRNGGDCKVPNCRFTHIKTACKFNPCTNRFCHFIHEEGQRGTFADKVWVADEAKEHVSERKFVKDEDREDLVLPGSEGVGADEHMPEVIV